jgi:phosphonate utilization associated putative membrane protein
VRGGGLALSWSIVAAVLFGALLHASWNAMVKAGSDKALDTAGFQLAGSLVSLVLLLFVGLPARASWPWLLASALIHVGYFTALAGAYRHGDLGLTYPLMRGTAPLLVALSAALTVGESPSPVAWAGVLAVSCGVLALGLSRHAMDSPRAVAFALANALVIASYTVVDARGVRASGDALQYVAGLTAVAGSPFSIAVLARRGWGNAAPYLRRRAPVALLGACASIASYGIALWAMTRAPVATIAALRETSVLFAALIGTCLLKESFTLRRALGTGVIVAGVMALRLA